MQRSCTYNGTDYSDGAVVCQNGYEDRCNDGAWDALGTPCGETVRERTPEHAFVHATGLAAAADRGAIPTDR